MRTLNVAIHAYRLDCGQYPPPLDETTGAADWRLNFATLTTPMAYLSGEDYSYATDLFKTERIVPLSFLGRFIFHTTWFWFCALPLTLLSSVIYYLCAKKPDSTTPDSLVVRRPSFKKIFLGRLVFITPVCLGPVNTNEACRR